jgi:hypothetical protein
VFFGESMFSRERDASKVALARLSERALWRDSNSSTASYLPLICAHWEQAYAPHEFSALVARLTAGPDMPLFSAA